MINLISQEAQRQLRADQFHQALKIFGFFMTAIFFAGFVMFLPAFIALQYFIRDLTYAREAEERSPVVTRALEERAKALSGFESLARDALTSAQEASSFESILREVVRIVPAGITLSGTRFEKNTFSIDGRYQHRSFFLAFLKAVEASALVKGVSSPLSNLLKETDASFHITLSL